MSGHSKWSKIKRQKGLDDQKRGMEFSKLSRAITVAVMTGKSGDPDQNPSLRLAMEKARAINMPKANIERAIAKGVGSGSGTGEQAVFEGYGPMGVAIMVTAVTDNRQRATAQIKNVFERFGGSLGAPGSAGFMFERASGQLTPKSWLDLSGEPAEKVKQLIAALEELEDVVEVVSVARFIQHQNGESGSV